MRKITLVYEGEEEQEAEKNLAGAIFNVIENKNVMLRSYVSSNLEQTSTKNQNIEIPEFIKNTKKM